MTEADLLFVVLAVLYGWECSCWVPRGSVVFRTWLGRRWRPAHPGALLGNARGGFVFAPPLPPLGTVLTAGQLPLSLSARAVLAFVAPGINPGGRPPQTSRLVRWEDIRTLEARGRNVLVNGELMVKAASPNYATRLVEQLQQLQKLAADKRDAAIRKLFLETLDTQSVERRWKEFQTQTGRLRWVANVLFAYLFIGAPLLIWQYGLRQTWQGLLVCLLALTVTTALLFHRAHKLFYPTAEDERFTHFLITLLAPASTIRARDVLSRPLLEGFHPLALARVFCGDEEFRRCARFVLAEIRYPALPLCPNPEPLAREVERQSRLLWQEVVEKFIRQKGLVPEDLLRPPAPADATCVSYCPRCLVQFTAGAEVCEDCGGLALVKFAAAKASSKVESH